MRSALPLAIIASVLFLLTANPLKASHQTQQFNMTTALAAGYESELLAPSVALHFGNSAPIHAKSEPVINMGEYITNKAMHRLNKTEQQACHWAFVSALNALQQQALEQGGNAVVEIRSYRDGDLQPLVDQFECGAGLFVADVTLVGRVVKQ